jgi:tetratricopeptide (TPR) repeat protein
MRAGSGMTQTGEVIGTPSYMAPEQAGGRVREIGPAADVYALGAILYELLTGRPPFRAATPLDTLGEVLSKDPRPPSRLQARVPRDLDTICLKCLQKQPARRYASAEALAGDLRRFLNYQAIEARPPGPLTRAGQWVRRRRLALGAAAAALVLAAVLTSLGVGHARWRQGQRVRAFVDRGAELLGDASAAAREDEAERLFEEALQNFSAALAIDDRNEGAARGLIDLYLRRCRRALDHHDYEVARGILIPLKKLDRRGLYAREIAGYERQALGTCTWRVQTDPAGCRVTLARLDEDCRPGTPVEVGVTPLAAKDIAPGSYEVVLTHPRYPEVRCPLHVGHNEVKALKVPLVSREQIPDGMVYVPAGEFLFGDPRSGTARTVDVPGFFIDRTEVTGADYEKFVRATGAPPPDRWDGSPTCPPPLRDWAVHNVSWFEALEYARWAGKRLPTEREWEKAARGVDGRDYPWGNRFEPRRCNCRESLQKGGLQVGRRRAGASPYGCLDMAGNVWEWTLDRERRHRADRVIRGGAAHSGADEVLSFRRKGAPPGGSRYGGLNLLGFRCVKPLAPEPPKKDILDALTSRGDLAAAAEFYWDHGRHDRARACADRLLKRNPRSVPGNFWLAAGLEEEGRLGPALDALKLVYGQRYAYKTRAREVREDLVRVIGKLERTGRSVDRRFLELPRWFRKAKEALDGKDYREAEAQLRMVLEVDPANEVADEEMAQVCAATDRADEAARHRLRRIDSYRTALREDPDNPELCNGFADYLAQNGLLLEEGLALARRAVELEPHTAEYRATLADVLHRLGRAPEAVAAIKAALELDPEETPYRELLKEYQAAAKEAKRKP